VIVVVGAHADRILPELAALHAAYVMNGEWRRGIGGSIACGAQEIQRRRASLSGIMLIVADLPRLDAQVLERLVAAFDATPGCRVASAYADTVGVPAIFGRSYFGPLTELAADRGAQPLLLAGREHVIAVAWPEGARDVDVRADAPDAT
jgi:molybdenum cofactor cytidylyltransferase